MAKMRPLTQAEFDKGGVNTGSGAIFYGGKEVAPGWFVCTTYLGSFDAANKLKEKTAKIQRELDAWMRSNPGGVAKITKAVRKSTKRRTSVAYNTGTSRRPSHDAGAIYEGEITVKIMVPEDGTMASKPKTDPDNNGYDRKYGISFDPEDFDYRFFPKPACKPGDVIITSSFGGARRTAWVEDWEPDIKNKRPGFTAIEVKKSASGWVRYAENHIWGYDDQIERVIASNVPRPKTLAEESVKPKVEPVAAPAVAKKPGRLFQEQNRLGWPKAGYDEFIAITKPGGDWPILKKAARDGAPMAWSQPTINRMIDLFTNKAKYVPLSNMFKQLLELSNKKGTAETEAYKKMIARIEPRLQQLWKFARSEALAKSIVMKTFNRRII